MKPNKQETRDKTLLAAVRELDELRRLRRSVPLVKLAKPIQTGWKKSHRLRDDCASRPDAERYRLFLKEIDDPVFCRKADFMNRRKIVIKARLKVISHHRWNELAWPESYKRYFMFGDHREDDNQDRDFYSMRDFYVTGQLSLPRNSWIKGYKINQPFYYEEIVTPYFVTHRKPILPEVERRIVEVTNIIEKSGGWARYHHLKQSSFSWRMEWVRRNTEWLAKDDHIRSVDSED